MVEHAAVNRGVVGSSPTSGAIFSQPVRIETRSSSRVANGAMTWVYILQSTAGKFYMGQTNELAARLESHNRLDRPEGKFTRKNGPWAVVWTEPHQTRAQAMARERQIKRMNLGGFVPLSHQPKELVGPRNLVCNRVLAVDNSGREKIGAPDRRKKVRCEL